MKNKKIAYSFCTYFPRVYPWREKIIREAFDKVDKLNIDWKAKVWGFKEKYWSFRTEYEEWLTDEMRDIFNKLMEDTYYTCAICWRKWEQRNVRWRFTPLCYYHSFLNYINTMLRKLKMLFSL